MQPPILYARFRTPDRCYVYDTYSNQILATPQAVWEAFDRAVIESNEGSSQDRSTETSALDEARNQLLKAQETGFLRRCDITSMQFYSSPEMLVDRMSRRMPQLTLELSERCNFRCRYCCYTYDDERLSSRANMSWETATKAIDIFRTHSTDADERCISFWGGEPLIRFRFLKRLVEYAKATGVTEPLRFQFTTNASLITADIAAFLKEHDVGLLVSLDGPQNVHDQQRVGADGRGTFDQVLRGLRHLRDAGSDYYSRRIRFNCVIARTTPLDTLKEFFEQQELLRGHAVTFSPASADGIPQQSAFGGLSAEQCTFIDREFLATEAVNQGRTACSRLTIKALQRIALRPRCASTGCVAPNGCCVPLLKKMHVRVSGDVYLCEQFPHANCVGNVNDGLDLEKAAKLARDYAEHSLPQCKQCWAVRLCGSCYQHAMRDCKWDAQLRKAECRKQRQPFCIHSFTTPPCLSKTLARSTV